MDCKIELIREDIKTTTNKTLHKEVLTYAASEPFNKYEQKANAV